VIDEEIHSVGIERVGGRDEKLFVLLRPLPAWLGDG